MLSKNKKQILENFLADLPKEQIVWTSGYLAGLASNYHQPISVKSNTEATIIYISETGNSKKIAGNLAGKIKEIGGRVKLKSSEQYR
jgi:sulfite reductase (NADPH) flavoprotein alpha-component